MITAASLMINSYRIGESGILLVVNAAEIDEDLPPPGWKRHRQGGTILKKSPARILAASLFRDARGRFFP